MQPNDHGGYGICKRENDAKVASNGMDRVVCQQPYR